MPADVTLGELHDILQVVMGWDDEHLHQFRVKDVYYSDPEFGLGEVQDEFAVTLREIAPRSRMRFMYEYDFGDGWKHDVVVEKTLVPEPRQRYPVCVEGERACPPEDSGGVFGYEYRLEALRDPNHDWHGETLEWMGEDFDPEAFDMDQVNRYLMKGAKTLAS